MQEAYQCCCLQLMDDMLCLPQCAAGCKRMGSAVLLLWYPLHEWLSLLLRCLSVGTELGLFASPGLVSHDLYVSGTQAVMLWCWGLRIGLSGGSSMEGKVKSVFGSI